MEPHAVLIVDDEGRIERANGVARALFGDCVGRACRDVVGVHDRLHDCGCEAFCAHRLARGITETNASVGQVAGRPMRVLCAGIGGEVVVTLVTVGKLPGVAEPLTDREREVLGHVAAGLSSPRIARRLGISPATVRSHVEHIRDKLGARSRAEAVAKATALGLVGP